MSRAKASSIVTIVGSLLGIVCSLSFCHAELSLFGRSIFDLFDFVSGQIFLPLGGFLTSLFVGWYVPKHIVREELTNQGTLRGRFIGIYLFCVRCVCPTCILLIFLHQMEII